MSTLSGMVVHNTRPVYSYDWLCKKMADRGLVELRLNDGTVVRGLINGIRPEDGSGRHWLVTLYYQTKHQEVYVRTA
jgi:hypothetical protein